MSDISVKGVSRPDVVAVESGPRPTPTPVRVDFKRALVNAGVMAVRGATAVANVLPGAPQIATALRGPAVPFVPGPMTPLALPGAGGVAATPAVSMDPAGPGGTGGATVGVGGASTAGDAQSALQQMQDQELSMLMIQQQASAQQNYFMTMSNLAKSQSDTEKAAIQNIK